MTCGLNDGFLLLAVDRLDPRCSKAPPAHPDFHKGPNLSRSGDEVDLVSIPRPIAEEDLGAVFSM